MAVCAVNFRHLACEEERLEVARLLIQHGAKAELLNKVQYFYQVRRKVEYLFFKLNHSLYQN